MVREQVTYCVSTSHLLEQPFLDFWSTLSSSDFFSSLSSFSDSFSSLSSSSDSFSSLSSSSDSFCSLSSSSDSFSSLTSSSDSFSSLTSSSDSFSSLPLALLSCSAGCHLAKDTFTFISTLHGLNSSLQKSFYLNIQQAGSRGQ